MLRLFWPCSIIFETSSNFFDQSDISPYKFAYLSMGWNIWPYSKKIEHGQKNLNATKIFFELADGLGILVKILTKGSLSYPLCVECFSQLSFDSEVYIKSATAADFVYTTSESNESCEKHSAHRW